MAWVGAGGGSYAHGVDVAVGRVAVGEFDGGDAERPDICLPVVAGFLEDFGSHPEGSTDDGFPLRHGVVQLDGDAEIGQLRNRVVCEENVAGFDILGWTETETTTL